MPMQFEQLKYAHTEGHTDVCYTEDGNKLITCGADGDIRIWSIDESEDTVHTCIGECAVSVQQKGSSVYVATSSNDIQILTLPNGERDGVLDRFTAPINHVAVGKKTQFIALAGEDMEVKLINLEKDPKETITYDGLTGPCLSVAICPNAKMIAASSGDTKLRIWELGSNKLLREISCFPKVNSFENAKLLCRIHFHPHSGAQVAYPDKDTVVILNTVDWSQYATLSCPEVSASYSIVQYSPCGSYILATTDEGHFVIWELSTERVVDEGKHEKSIAICGLMWNPKGNGEIVYTDIEGQLGIISRSAASDSENKESEELENVFNDASSDCNGNFENDPINDDEDDENVISVEKLKRQCMGSPMSELKNFEDESSHAHTPRPSSPVTPLQTHFMPSSTPEHLEQRYLCWNNVGIVRCYGNDAVDDYTTKSIEVEFHDATFHNSLVMTNYMDHTMAALSKSALVVANSTRINVIPLSTSTKEWQLSVDEYEEVVLVAASENLVCFATRNYLVHICSVFGTQRAIVSIPGPLVSMVAFGNVLMVAYHMSGVRKGDQCINIRLIKFEGTAIDAKDITSALGPESTLMWLGFSDVGTPAMMDSLGMLSLYPNSSNTWIPFCDTTRHRKSPSDGFFVTTVFESNQTVGGIKCKGSAYPGFTPKPVMCELPLEPPFAEPALEKTQMEMNLFTWSTLQVSNVDKKFKETALKTFALACRNDLDQRALELIEILANPQVAALALKYASKVDKRRVVEKLMEIASRIADDADDVGVAELSTPEPTSVKPVYRKLSLSAAKYSSKYKTQNLQKSQEASSNVSQTEKPEIAILSNTASENSQNSDETDESIRITQEEPKNPFLRSLKKSEVVSTNPLSLTDKYAGIAYDKEAKENKNGQTSEKRKLSDSENGKPKEKQRKLDSFRFTKSSS